MTDVVTFAFVGTAALVSSYLAIRPSREGDVDNLYTGGFAFVTWLVWSFSAYSVEFNVGSGTPDVNAYPGLAYIGFAMSALMLLGLTEEVFQRLGIDLRETMKREFGM